MVSESITQKFDLIGLDLGLHGTVQCDKPRVSKKVLIRTVQRQNAALQQLIQEFDVFRVSFPTDLIDSLKKALESTEQKLAQARETVTFLKTTVTRQEEQISEILAKQDSLTFDQGSIKKALEHNRIQTDDRLDSIEERMSRMETKDIVLQADKVIFGEETVAVTLSRSEEMLKKVLTMQDSQSVLLGSHTEELEKRATVGRMEMQEAALEALSVNVERSSQTNRNMIDSFVADSSRKIEQHASAIKSIQEELSLKVDQETMQDLIDAKYEEIISQLQTALESASDDDKEFQKLSTQLQDVVKELCESKADRLELQEIKEKMTFDFRVRDQLENIKQFLDMKINREEAISVIKTDREKLSKMVSDLSKSMNVNMKKALAEAIINNTASASIVSQSINKTQSRAKTADPSKGPAHCLSCHQPLSRKGLQTAGGGTPTTSAPVAPMSSTGRSQLQAMGHSMGGGFQLPVNTHIGKKGLTASSPKQVPADLLPKIHKQTVALTEPTSVVVGLDGAFYQGERPHTTHGTRGSGGRKTSFGSIKESREPSISSTNNNGSNNSSNSGNNGAQGNS